MKKNEKIFLYISFFHLMEFIQIDPESNNSSDLKNHYVNLISSERTKFKVPTNILPVSIMITIMLENVDFDDEDLEESERDIPLLNINDKCLKKVIEFMEHYHVEKMPDIKKPLISSLLEDCVQKWYVDFIDVDDDFLYSLINAANYMDIQPLLNLGCAKVALSIRNKPPEEIREILKLDKKSKTNDNEKDE